MFCDLEIKERLQAVRENRRLEAYDDECRDMASDKEIFPLRPLPEIVCDQSADWKSCGSVIYYDDPQVICGPRVVANLKTRSFRYEPFKPFKVIDRVDDDGSVNFHKVYFIDRPMTDAEYEFCVSKKIELMKLEQRTRLSHIESGRRIMRDGVPAED